jgi:alkylation response protein AidB-like acyl-CoA dehydrogenase
VADHDVRAAARARLDAPADELPPFWADLVAQGWTGLHVPEHLGGQGFGLAETAVVLEELGRAVAPGPYLPTVVASAVVVAVGPPPALEGLLGDLAAGIRLGAVGGGGSLARDREGRVSGGGGLVLGGALADVLLLAVGDDLAVVEPTAAGLRLEPCDGLDPTRRLVAVHADGVAVADDRLLGGAAAAAVRIGRALAAAEAAGGARACTEAAVEYAKARVQFGRPIGSFQAVKHHCADMLVDSERAAAAAWDAARTADAAPTPGPGPTPGAARAAGAPRTAGEVRSVDAAPAAGASRTAGEAGAGGAGDAVGSLTAAVAAVIALPAFRRCAERNIQVHGGIGYTWEHDAHLYLRRAAQLAALFGADRDAPADLLDLLAAGTDAGVSVDLPPEAEAFRAEAAAFRRRHDALPPGERRTALIESGYAMPHWPPPWGRGAGPVEQIVIEEELAGVEHPALGIGAWIVLTLIQHGTPDQVERWVRPSLAGELSWCQLFSEPDAGSDAAAIRTRATRVDGGWLLNGQKVWTSGAERANRGLATVRTDPDAPKHAGVTVVAVDMHAPGVTVRPLREITGETLFNEVFLDDVFVADDDVVGAVNQGWTVARATLGNERVSIGANTGSMGSLVAGDLLPLAARWAPGDAGVAREVAALVADERAMALLNLRQVTRAIVGGPPGVEGNVTKLLSAEHAQRVSGLALRIAGPAAVAGGSDLAARTTRSYLFARCLTIAGGTSEIVRNLIAERILGLPRDPLAR